MEALAAVGDEPGARQRPTLDPLGQDQLALGEESGAGLAGLRLQVEGDGGAAQPVLGARRRHPRDGQRVEAEVAEAPAGGADQGGLVAEGRQALQQVGVGQRRDAAIGGGAPHSHRRHDVADRDGAEAGDEDDELAVAIGHGMARGCQAVVPSPHRIAEIELATDDRPTRRRRGCLVQMPRCPHRDLLRRIPLVPYTQMAAVAPPPATKTSPRSTAGRTRFVFRPCPHHRHHRCLACAQPDPPPRRLP